MPIYEYRCPCCEENFEVIKSRANDVASDLDQPCPKCSILSQRIPLSQTSSPVFKGTGFYQTDYKSKSSQK
jgi:putative FmdB family regulatory protein